MHFFFSAMLSLRDGRTKERSEDCGTEVQKSAPGSKRVGRVRKEYA